MAESLIYSVRIIPHQCPYPDGETEAVLHQFSALEWNSVFDYFSDLGSNGGNVSYVEQRVRGKCTESCRVWPQM